MQQLVKNALIILFISTFISNCSTSRIVMPDERLTIEKQARIRTHNNESVSVYNVIALQDSVYAIDYYSGINLFYHKKDIQSIAKIDRLKGAGQGLLLGAASGLVGTFLGSLAIGTILGDEFLVGYAPLFALIGGGYGAVIGPVIGFIVGNKEYHIFEDDSLNSLHPDSILLPEELPQKSLYQIATTRIPHKINEPRYQIAISGYGSPGGNDAIEVMGVHFRRFIDLSKSDNSQSRFDKFYINLSISGYATQNFTDGDRINKEGSQLFLAVGHEIISKRTLRTGIAGFGEIGMVAANESKTINWSGNSNDDRNGTGFTGALGVRAWRNFLFSEIQVGYDTCTEIVAPRLVVGIRF